MLAPNEVITEVDVYDGRNSLYSHWVVEGIAFRTNLGNEYGPYGLTIGDMNTSMGSRLNGLIIRDGMAMDSIIFAWQCN